MKLFPVQFVWVMLFLEQWVGTLSAQATPPEPPTILLQKSPVGIVQMAAGGFAFFERRRPDQPALLTTADGMPVALEPSLAVHPLCSRRPYRLLLDRDGELHEVCTEDATSCTRRSRPTRAAHGEGFARSTATPSAMRAPPNPTTAEQPTLMARSTSRAGRWCCPAKAWAAGTSSGSTPTGSTRRRSRTTSPTGWKPGTCTRPLGLRSVGGAIVLRAPRWPSIPPVRTQGAPRTPSRRKRTGRGGLELPSRLEGPGDATDHAAEGLWRSRSGLS